MSFRNDGNDIYIYIYKEREKDTHIDIDSFCYRHIYIYIQTRIQKMKKSNNALGNIEHEILNLKLRYLDCFMLYRLA